MRFEPLTEKELNEKMNVDRLKEGPCKVYIDHAEEIISKKSGNIMTCLYVVASQAKASADMRIYITHDNNFGHFLLIKICKAIGAMDQYETGDIPLYFWKDKEMDAFLRMGKSSTDKSTGKEYPAKLEICNFVERDSKAEKPFEDDDITF